MIHRDKKTGNPIPEGSVSTVTSVMDNRRTSSHETSRLQGISRKVFSFPGFLGTILVLEAWSTLALFPHDPDVWWHVVVGAQILKTHTWPLVDPYSFTAHGNAWIAYEWLGEIIMALAVRAGGLAGLAVLRICLAAVLGLLLYYYAHLRCRNVKAAFAATALMFWLSYGFFWMRPQLMGFIFLLLVLICLERFRQGQQKSLWVLPVIFLIWVNTHGSFVLGFVVLGVYWASGLWEKQLGHLRLYKWTPGQRRHLEVIFLLSELALVVTPYGTRLAAYPFEMSLFLHRAFANISEWGAIGFGETWGKEVLILLLVFFVALAVLRPSFRMEDFALLFLAIYASCVHRRMFVFLALILTPLLASMLARWMSSYKPREDPHTLNACLMVLLITGMFWFFPSHRKLERSANQSYPHRAVQYIRSHPEPGPMLNEWRWGGYLIWSLGSHHKVFIDGRADLYEYAGVLSDYLHITQLAPQTMFLLRKYSIQSCLMERSDPLGTLLASLPNWHRVYADNLAVLYVHKSNTTSPTSTEPGISALVQKPTGSRKVTHHFRMRHSAE